MIISAGEKLSARLLTGVLQSKGIPASYINLDKLIAEKFDEKTIDQSFYDYIAARLAERVDEVLRQGRVPIVTGFFGPVPGSLLKTIGRGYTDLTAALIAVGMRAKELQIWKEVDGIFTADPRKVEKARLLSSISPEEAAELTYYGSEVIHPFTMDQVIRASIPIRIKNTFNPSGYGTVILPKGFKEEDHTIIETTESPVLSPMGSNNAFPPIRGNSTKHPTAATIKNQVTVLNVHSNKKSVSHGFFAHLFQTLDKY